MNYELCKKLKDAGFPQKEFSLCKHGFKKWGLYAKCRCKEQERCYAPTLSELIDALGDREVTIKIDKRDKVSEEYKDVPNSVIVREGLAKFWLKLNESKN